MAKTKDKKYKKEKKEKKEKGCGCRKRGKKCINANPCTECKKANKEELAIEKIKRPRGRPRKIDIDNKVKVGTECKVNEKRGRGRPKKVYALSAYAESQLVPLVPTRTYKAYGFCPNCKLPIAEIDVKGDGFECPKCDMHGMLGELTKELGLERAKTKKEYLQSVNSVYTWHDYNSSSNINTIKRTDLIEEDDHEDSTESVKSDEEIIINKINGKKVE